METIGALGAGRIVDVPWQRHRVGNPDGLLGLRDGRGLGVAVTEDGHVAVRGHEHGLAHGARHLRKPVDGVVGHMRKVHGLLVRVDLSNAGDTVDDLIFPGEGSGVTHTHAGRRGAVRVETAMRSEVVTASENRHAVEGGGCRHATHADGESGVRTISNYADSATCGFQPKTRRKRCAGGSGSDEQTRGGERRGA